jgi:4-hydroxy-2-oxoheptanedioate aldolase
MQLPVNAFKQALCTPGAPAQIGLWLALGDAGAAEICAGAGFDWLVVDGEHAPNTLTTMLAQLRALAAYPGVQPVARIAATGASGALAEVQLKQVLDLGFQTVLVPMVDSAAQAQALVRAVRYPLPQDDAEPGTAPGGVRGLAGARASRWGRIDGYARRANREICLLLQVETRAGLDALEAICAVDGVDGVFIGPADLSAALGRIGAPQAVQAQIDAAIGRIVACGKAAGILATDPALAEHYLRLGARFVAVGLDTQLLLRGCDLLAARFKPGPRAG